MTLYIDIRNLDLEEQHPARHPIDLLRVQSAFHVLGTRNVDRAAVTCMTNRHTEIPA